LIVDGAGNHKRGELAIPANVTLARLPAHSPELYCGVEIYVALGCESRLMSGDLPFERQVIDADANNRNS
jgi:hypothetical protein